MHIKSVTAEAFGPLVDQTLHLSPGLTVIHGGNESAKSSWHAAIYAGLCGRRRAKGKPTNEDRRFAELRRPWDGDTWKVRCEIVLDDGREVSLHHDLDGKVDCRALDARGRDLSNDIVYDGAPDGSRWLGLNRRTFAATACVNQTELLRVLEAAGELQRDIERAAATAGHDETAASALAALKQFAGEHVGRDHANSKRPLRRALVAEQLAQRSSAEAQRAHDDYLRLVVEGDQAEDAAVAATADREAAEAAGVAAERLVAALGDLATARGAASSARAVSDDTQATALSGQRRLLRARELSALLPQGSPPSGRSDDAVAQQVAQALGSWRSAPDLPALSGPSAHELRTRADNLPPPPDGDVGVDPAVERLRSDYLRATALLDRADQRRAEPPDLSNLKLAAAVRAGPMRVQHLAEHLADPVTEIEPGLHSTLDRAAIARAAASAALRAAEEQEFAALDRPDGGCPAPALRSTRLRLTASIAAAAFLVGVVLVVLGQLVPGAAAAALGGLGLLAALLRRSASSSDEAAEARTAPASAQQVQAARQQLRDAREACLQAERNYVEAEATLGAATRREAVDGERRRAAEAEAAELGLPADPAALRALAEQAQRARSATEAFDRWSGERDADEQAREFSARRLVAALAAKGYAGDDPLRAYTAYERDCDRRADQARQAQQRDDLLRQLDDRAEAERAASQAQRLREDALDQLVHAAQAARLVADGPAGRAGGPPTAATASSLASRLHEWLEQRATTLAAVEEQRDRWQELKALLDGRTVNAVEASVTADGEAAQAAQARAAAAATDVAVKERAVHAAASAAVDAAAAQPHSSGPPPSPDHLVDPVAAGAFLRARRQAVAAALTMEKELAHRAASGRGQVAERERALPSVAEAEEALAQARGEVERVRSLSRMLDLTTEFLEQAQTATYNDLAPVLNRALEKWLPRITDGRYVQARVDPETLNVTVESETGAVRPAERLSVGTAEQVYLLLRVALAEHLADRSSVSPLLLDDVTVQADPRRTEAILDMCKALADEGRQVVLFAQEPSVAAWADEHLRAGGQHSLVRLTVPTAA